MVQTTELSVSERHGGVGACPTVRGRDLLGSLAPMNSAATPIFINCRDRLTTLKALINWLEDAGHERIVMVDNDSTYGPLLAYFEETPHQVVRLGRNLGPEAIWMADLPGAIGEQGRYVVTDSDIVPDSHAPNDAVERFDELLSRYPDVDKVGFGLRIDDLPDTYQFRDDVVDWEAQFWEEEVEPGVYRADLDTTFALYRPSVRSRTFPALRTGFPYVARHMPWYADSGKPSEEEEYYRRHADAAMTNWNADELPFELRAAIEHHRARRTGTPGRA